MSKWDKYAIDNLDDPSDKWGKYRIKDSDQVELTKGKGDQLQYSPEEFLVDDYGTRDLAPFKKYWNKRGDNIDKKLSFYHKHLIDKKPHYYTHKPTWKDRLKEVGQGLAGFAGGVVDIGNDVADLIGVPKKENIPNDYRTQWKNAKPLKTKNIDTTSYVLRGMGEFTPEILSMAGIGLGAKAIGKGVSKGTKHIKLPIETLKKYGSKIGNFLETPITGTNIASFAGAGAAHGVLHTPGSDGKEKQPAWYEELPTVIGGGLVGGGSVNLGKKSLQQLAHYAPESGLKNILTKTVGLPKYPGKDRVEEFLINHINKKQGIPDIDHEFISVANSSNIPVNSLSAYKNPSESEIFKLASQWKHPKYKEYLDMLENKILEDTSKILDEGFSTYKKGQNVHNISEDISKKLNRVYDYRRENSRKNFELAHSKITDNDYVIPKKTLDKLKELYELSAKVPFGENTGIDQLNRLSKNALKRLGQDENSIASKTAYNEARIPLRTMVNMRQAINEQLQKTAIHPGALGKVKYKAADLKPLIDEDILLAINNGTISDPEFSRIYHSAKDYHKDYLGPFKKSDLFRKIADEAGVEKLDVNDVIYKSLNKKGTSTDLENLINEAYKDSPNTISKTNLTESINRLKRIKLQEDLLKQGDASSDHIFDYITRNEHDPFFKSKLVNNKRTGNAKLHVPTRLNREVKPVIRKYKDLKEAYKKHDITNYKEEPWQTGIVADSILGALGGGLVGNNLSSTVTGASLMATPRAIYRYLDRPIANKLYKSFNDPDFLNNTTNIFQRDMRKFNGLPPKKNTFKKILNKDAIKKQAPLSLIRKNEGEKWGE